MTVWAPADLYIFIPGMSFIRLDTMRTIDWNDASSSIAMIDQTLLPVECKVIECKTLSSLCEAIVSLRIRGGPPALASQEWDSSCSYPEQ
ncbi:hypothetical protein [Methanomethylovorans sp.]|uniref:hypothetical protein n=1 Tax=Methanomethylovorans sp. TaxID=2758717 RepID=UPI00351BFC0C